MRRLLKRITYSAAVTGIVRWLGIGGYFHKIYNRLFFPSENQMTIVFNETEAIFAVHDYGELRYIEGNFISGYRDERFVLRRLMQNLNEGDIAFDVGANIGIHTVYMAKEVGSVGKVVAFEPEPNCFKKLQLNIELNGLTNIMPMNVALGQSFSKATLQDGRLMAGCVEASPEYVNIAPGDALVNTHNLPIPNVVKIDVEGYEYDVIKGLEKTLRDKGCLFVCCEVHPTVLPNGITYDNVLDLLKSFGFVNIDTAARCGLFHIFASKQV